MESPRLPSTRRRPHPIRWLRRHPRSADVLLGVLLTSVSVTFHLLDFDTDDEFTDPAWWTVALVVASVFPIAWRRNRTVLATVIVVGAQVATALAEVVGTGFLGVVVMLYSLGAHGVGRARDQAVAASAVSIGLLFVAGVAESEFDIGDFISSTVVLVTAFVLGDNLRRRRLAADDLQGRLERAERERDLLAQQRVSDERTRIARELHDVVAHSVTAMTIQAAAARRNLDRSPADAAAALDNIESTGRAAVNELRGVLGVLRRQDGGPQQAHRAPQPGIDGIVALVESSSDLHVELSIDGVHADALRTTDPAVDLAAYRLVQEALTNVRRHGVDVTTVAVELAAAGGELVVTVTDDGAGRPNDTTDDGPGQPTDAADGADTVDPGSGGPGYGLAGMRERADALGGDLRAGPWGSRGWRLVARLPLADPSTIGGRR